MAVPKGKTSKARKRYQVCGNCGYYDNEEVVSKAEKKAD